MPEGPLCIREGSACHAVVPKVTLSVWIWRKGRIKNCRLQLLVVADGLTWSKSCEPCRWYLTESWRSPSAVDTNIDWVDTCSISYLKFRDSCIWYKDGNGCERGWRGGCSDSSLVHAGSDSWPLLLNGSCLCVCCGETRQFRATWRD